MRLLYEFLDITSKEHDVQGGVAQPDFGGDLYGFGFNQPPPALGAIASSGARPFGEEGGGRAAKLHYAQVLLLL